MPDLIHYVKFQRGSQAAFEQLKAADRLDPDTLYFVYIDKSATKGQLYLGDKLISGSVDGSGSILSDVSIADLTDVLLKHETLINNQILVFDKASRKWKNKNLSEIISTAIQIMKGATSTENGVSGLVPAPKIGDQNKFLSGDGTWKTIKAPIFDKNNFATSKDNEIILKGSKQAEAGTYLQSDGCGGVLWTPIPTGFLDKEIVEHYSDIDLNKENTIFMVRKTGNLSDIDRFDEYMVVNGAIEKMGNDLSGYATNIFVKSEIKKLSDILNDTEVEDSVTGNITTIPGLVSKVNRLTLNAVKIGNLSNYSSEHTLVQAIDEINDRLAWTSIETN